MVVEWRCIQSVAVCFVYTLDESFAKNAVHVLQAIPALIHALMAAPIGHKSTRIVLIVARTRAVNP